MDAGGLETVCGWWWKTELWSSPESNTTCGRRNNWMVERTGLLSSSWWDDYQQVRWSQRCSVAGSRTHVETQGRRETPGERENRENTRNTRNHSRSPDTQSDISRSYIIWTQPCTSFKCSCAILIISSAGMPLSLQIPPCRTNTWVNFVGKSHSYSIQYVLQFTIPCYLLEIHSLSLHLEWTSTQITCAELPFEGWELNPNNITEYIHISTFNMWQLKYIGSQISAFPSHQMDKNS